MLKDDVQDTDLKGKKFTFPYTPVVWSAVADDCRHSSKSWAQAFEYAVDAMGGPVGIDAHYIESLFCSAEAYIRVAGWNNSAVTDSVHYVFTGFMSPMDNPPTINAVRAGQTVPVKFSLGGNRGLAVLSAAASTATSCANGSVVDLTDIAVANPGASVFAYDALTGQYQFNWQTDRAWAGTCRRLSVRLDDGTVHNAEFRLR